LMPFITEAVWEALRAADGEVTGNDELLVTARWPAAGARDEGAEGEVEAVAELIRTIRNARLASAVPAGKRVALELLADEPERGERAEAARRYIQALARVEPFTVHAAGSISLPATGIVATPLGAAWLPLDDEQAAVGTPPDRVGREHLERGIARLEALLANRDFTSKAPAVVVDRERQRLRELEAELRQIGG